MTIDFYNMQSANGNPVPNQIIVTGLSDIWNKQGLKTGSGILFQSYQSRIAFENSDKQVFIDSAYWDYSRTTTRYLAAFLGVSGKKDIQRGIDSGEYILVNFNKRGTIDD